MTQNNKIFLGVLITLLAVSAGILFIDKEPVVSLEDPAILVDQNDRESPVFNKEITYTLPNTWKDVGVESFSDLGTEAEYASSTFIGIKPAYSEIIPKITRYTIEVPYCSSSASTCSAYLHVDVMAYSDAQPYVLGCWSECEVFDKRYEKKLLDALQPSFVSNEITWVCRDSEFASGWTLTHSCTSFAEGKEISAEFSYSLDLEELGVLDKARDGTLAYKDYVELVRRDALYKQAEEEFYSFVKTLKVAEGV